MRRSERLVADQRFNRGGSEIWTFSYDLPQKVMKSAILCEFCEAQGSGLITIYVQVLGVFYKAVRRCKIEDIFFEMTHFRIYAPKDCSTLFQKGIAMIGRNRS